MSTRRVLESYGYKVNEAASAREALEVWRPNAGEINMLITDMVMPDGLSGRDLGARLRAQKPELTVIFMSGYSAEVVGGDWNSCASTGAASSTSPALPAS